MNIKNKRVQNLGRLFVQFAQSRNTFDREAQGRGTKDVISIKKMYVLDSIFKERKKLSMKKIFKKGRKNRGVAFLITLSMLFALLPFNTVLAGTQTVTSVAALTAESGYGYTIDSSGSAIYDNGAKLRVRAALSNYEYTAGDVLTVEYDTSLDASNIQVLICNTNTIYESLGYLESGATSVSFTLPESSTLGSSTPANYIRFQNNDGADGDYFTLNSLTITREVEGSSSSDAQAATINDSDGYTLVRNSDGSVKVSYTPGTWYTLNISADGCDLGTYSEMVVDITPVSGMNLGILDNEGNYYRSHWGDGVFESGSRQTLTYSITSDTSGFVFYCDPPTGATLPSGDQTFTIHSVKFVNAGGTSSDDSSSDDSTTTEKAETKANFTDFSGSGYELVSSSEGGKAEITYSAGATVRFIANFTDYTYSSDDIFVVNYEGIDDVSSIEQVLIGYGTSAGEYETLSVSADTGSTIIYKLPDTTIFDSQQPTFIRFKGVLSSGTSTTFNGMGIYDKAEYYASNSDGVKIYDEDQCPAGLAVTYYTDIYSRGFAWSTDDTVDSNALEYVKASSGVTKDNVDWSTATTVQASMTESTDVDGVTWHLFKAHVKNLEKGATYYFRAGDYDTGYSEVGSFVVEGSSSSIDKLTFTHLTDAQEGSQSGYAKWARVLKEAYKKAPDSKFVAFTGDITNDSHATLNMWQWIWALDEPKDNLLNTVIEPSSGNHDTYAYSFTNRFDIDWADYDNGGTSDLKTGGCYSFTYGDDIVFINLNTNEANGGNSTFSAQKNWLINELETYKDCKWKVVQIHKGIMSGGDHTNDGEVDWLREILPPIFAEYEVDLVLQGHDHVYTRSMSYGYGSSYDGLTPDWTDPIIYEDYEFNGETRLLNLEPCGTHYVTINYCASKSYPEESNLDEVIYEGQNPISGNDCIVQPYLPMYGVVYIDGDMMIYDAYTYDSSTGVSTLYDTFAVQK